MCDTLPDIYCDECKNVMEYREDGNKGAGYYCNTCSYVELESELSESRVESQIKRRIYKRV